MDPPMTTARGLAAFIGIACLILFGGLVYAVSAVPAIGKIDLAVDAVLAPMRTEPLLVVSVWITALGAGATLFAVAVTATALLWTGTGHRFAVPFWTVYLGTEAMTWGTKFALDRARPVFLEIARASSPSFPSAHTAGAAAVYGFLSYIVIQRLPDSGSARLAILAAAALIIAGVAFSRVILSVHFFSDVIGGLAVAGAWLCVGVAIARTAQDAAPRRGF
jgi:undecaprenyl-diphosphatase